MIRPTLWVATRLLILFAISWFFGRDGIKQALYGRIHNVQKRIDEVKSVLDDAKNISEETNNRFVALENDVRRIIETGEKDRQAKIRLMEKEFREKIQRKENQIKANIEMERQQIGEKFKQALIEKTLDKVTTEIQEIRKTGDAEKEMMIMSLNSLSEVLETRENKN